VYEPLFLMFRFHRVKNSCNFKEINVFEDFEIKGGLLRLDRDVYLSIIRFLKSSILRRVWNKFFFYFLIFLSVFFVVHWH
jgi:hypothetical protein